MKPRPATDESTMQRVDSLLDLAEELLRAGKPADAVAGAERAHRLAPRDLRTLYYYAIIHGDCGRHEEAIALLRRALRRAPENDLFHAALGKELLDTGRARQAIAPLRRATELNPEFAPHWGRLGGLYYGALGDPERAEAPLRRALELEPRSAERIELLGECLFQLGRWNDALPLFQRLVRRRPQDARARVRLAVCYAGLDKHLRATRHAEAASRLCEDTAESHYDIGTMLAECGAGPAGVQHLARATELQPDDWRAWCNLGQALLDCGEPKAALKAGRRALRLEPSDGRNWCMVAECYVALRKPDQAIEAFERAMAVDAAYCKQCRIPARMRWLKKQ